MRVRIGLPTSFAEASKNDITVLSRLFRQIGGSHGIGVYGKPDKRKIDARSGHTAILCRAVVTVRP